MKAITRRAFVFVDPDLNRRVFDDFVSRNTFLQRLIGELSL